MSRKKHAGEAPFPLFAFQDIVTSIIGIMLLIVILLVLDLISKEDGVSAQAQVASSAHSVAITSEELAERERMLQQDVEALKVLKMAPATDLRKTYSMSIAEIQQQAATLENAESIANSSLRQLRQTAAVLDASLKAASAKKREISDRIGKAEAEAAIQRDKLKKIEATKNIVYIPEKGLAKAPILIVLRANGITALPAARRVGQQEWSGGMPQAKRAFTLWTASVSKKDSFFLVMVSPSQAGEAMLLVEQLRSQGFDVGYEPIPDGKDVAIGSEGE